MTPITMCLATGGGGSMEPRPLPSRDEGHPIWWGLWVRQWMGYLLLQNQGEDELRELVSQQAEAPGRLLTVYLDAAEARRLLEF